MIEIMNETYKLNQIVCVGFLNERNCYQVVSGRIFGWSDAFISLDVSYDFCQLEDIVRIRRDKIKYVKKIMENNYWR